MKNYFDAKFVRKVAKEEGVKMDLSPKQIKKAHRYAKGGDDKHYYSNLLDYFKNKKKKLKKEENPLVF
jgi:hypothetical protein